MAKKSTGFKTRLPALGHGTKQRDELANGIGRMLKAYAALPEAADQSERSSIREDVVVRVVSDLLAETTESLHLIDACCGKGALIDRVAGVDGADRIHYTAVDVDRSCTFSVEVGKKEIVRSFAKFRVRTRDITDLPADPAADLVVLSNVLHELSPSRFANILAGLNASLKNSPAGHLLIVDMETLPDEAPECVAINWTHDQIREILAAAGFSPSVTIHDKSTKVWIARTKRIDQINAAATNTTLRRFLREKAVEAADQRAVAQSKFPMTTQDDFKTWLKLTGTLARCLEELLILEGVPEENSMSLTESGSQ